MAGNRVTDNVGGNLSIETKQERNTYEEKNTSARISMNYGIKEGKTSLAVELVEAIPRATTKVPTDHVLDIPYAFIKNIRIDPSHRNTKDVFLEGVPNEKKESGVISFMKYLAMDRSDSLMRISNTAELHHLLEQKMRKNSKKISSPEVRRRPHARPLIGIRLTTKIPPYELVTGRYFLFFCRFPFQQRIGVVHHVVFRDGAFHDVLHAGDLIHDFLHDLLDDRAEAAGAGIALDRLAGDGVDGRVFDDELYAVHGQQFLVLLDEGILRFGQDFDEGLFLQRVKGDDDGETADEFRDEAEFQEVFRLDLLEELVHVFIFCFLDIGTEAHDAFGEAAVDDFIEAGESAAADEEDIAGVDLDHFLIRMLASALRRHVRHGAFQDLQESLLDAFTGDVAGDGDVLGLLGDLVDFIDVDDAALGFLDVIVRGLDEAEEDVLDVITDIAGLCEGGGIGNRKGHIEVAGEGLGKEGLAAAGRPKQDDIGFLQLYAVIFAFEEEAFVVIVHGDGQRDLGIVLLDDVLIDIFFDLFRCRHLSVSGFFALLCFVFSLFQKNVMTDVNAFAADVDAGAGDHVFDFVAGSAAEAADLRFFIFSVHGLSPLFLCHFRQLIAGEDMVDEAIVLRHLGCHEIIAFGVVFDGFKGLSAVLGKDAVQFFAQAEDLSRMDLDLGRLSLYAAQRLVDHHIRMREGIAFALRTGSQKDSRHAGTGSDTDGGNIRMDILHRIIDRKAGGHDAAGAVDVKMDIFRRVFGFQKEKLRNDDIGHMVFNLAVKEYDAVLQKAGINIIGALSASGLFDNNRYICHVITPFLLTK